MKAHEFIAWLVERAGGPLPAAKAMRSVGFQPTLHKICSGQVVSPKRSSAERIATHFGIPVDAVYDDALATRLYEQMSGSPADAGLAPPSGTPPAVIPLPAPAWPHDRFPHSYWESLTPAERAIVEESMLEAYDRLMARREQLRAATEKRARAAA